MVVVLTGIFSSCESESESESSESLVREGVTSCSTSGTQSSAEILVGKETHKLGWECHYSCMCAVPNVRNQAGLHG